VFLPGTLWPAFIARKENPDGGILLSKSITCHLNQTQQSQVYRNRR